MAKVGRSDNAGDRSGARIPNDAAPGICMNRIVARDRYNNAVLRHHDVPGAPGHRKTRFLQRSHCSKVRYARKPRFMAQGRVVAYGSFCQIARCDQKSLWS
jgi:hypothetical protein